MENLRQFGLIFVLAVAGSVAPASAQNAATATPTQVWATEEQVATAPAGTILVIADKATECIVLKAAKTGARPSTDRIRYRCVPDVGTQNRPVREVASKVRRVVLTSDADYAGLAVKFKK